MKTILLSIVAIFVLTTATAQYTQNFEGTEASLTGNCWTLTAVHVTNVPANVISGTGSMYTDPPTNPTTRDIITPALNVISTSFTISFNYKLSDTLHGGATRFIEMGLLDVTGNFTSLRVINLPNNTPTTVFNFNETFTLASTGWRKFVIKAGGAGGSGHSRLIFDDLSVSASPLYGTGICNSSPIAVNDVFNGTAGLPVSGNVMSNDNDPNGESMQSSVVVTSTDGVLVLNSDGSFVFTPNPGFTGPITTFTYHLTDSGFDPFVSNIGQVTINYSSPITLPVNLVSFTAMLTIANAVDLKWTTGSEKNVSHFEIEKSLDGQKYEKAGIVFASGNSAESLNYAYTDGDINTNQPGVIYYRLRSVDNDGSSELSHVRSIRIGKSEEQRISIQAYPNPVSNELRITIPSSWQGKKVSYEVFNTRGQAVAKYTCAISNQTEALNISSITPGIYVIKANCNGEVAHQKIIKK